MLRSNLNAGSFSLGFALALAACGAGGDGLREETAAIRTVAYVLTDCHQDATGALLRQSLQVIRGDQRNITVKELPAIHLPPLGICTSYGQFRAGGGSVLFGGFQRLGVSPDGTIVIFEVNLDLAPVGGSNPLTPDEQGIFLVHADGNGLRRLGPPSRAPASALVGVPSAGGGFSVNIDPAFRFSPDGRLVTFSDVGPGPMGEEATQIAILDVATGDRRFVTELPGAVPRDPAVAAPVTGSAFFIDDQTVSFNTRENAGGLNPDHEYLSFSVKTNGTDLSVEFRPPVALPGSHLLPMFHITGPAANTTFAYPVSGIAENQQPSFGATAIQEMMLFEGDNFLLQLTKFHRVDTAGGWLSNDRQRVFFVASADPLGTNPSENCQIFSVDVLGRELRQLTQFGTATHSDTGCLIIPGPACFTMSPVQDLRTGALLFYSTCDPLGTNPNGGGQTFVMAPDGTAMRQITHTHGAVTGDDGSVDVELPGPILNAGGQVG